MEASVEDSQSKGSEESDGFPKEDGDRIVVHTFTEFVDTSIDVLVERGLTEKDALDTVFHVATVLSQRGVLPEFPGEEATVLDMGKWTVAAADYGFIQLCEDAVR